MSLGTSEYSDSLEDAVDYAWVEGVVLVAAAGNNHTNKKFYPAAYENVIAVAATNHNDVKPKFSNYGGWVDVTAPGKDILSTAPDHRSVMWPKRAKYYAMLSGTSMATPHVAGVAGLVWAATDSSGVNKLCTTNVCVRDRIEDEADLITGIGTLWTHGRINAHKSVLFPATP